MFMMDLRLASINGRGLRSDSKRSQLLLYLQRRGIDICCLQETHFDSNFHEGILAKDYLSLLQHALMVVLEVSPGCK